MTNTLRRVITFAMSVGMTAVGMGVASSAAEAATLPSVVTGPPSEVGVTAATLSGDVDPNGATTTYYFEYGPTGSYGLDTTGVSAGAGTHETGVASRLEGLTPGTTYHFRLVAKSSLGHSYGSDSTFHTPAHAPTVLKSSVDDVTDTSAKVIAEIDAEGLASTWSVHYGTSPAFGLTGAAHAVGSATSSATVSAHLHGLVAHTTYYFEVVALNAAGSAVGTTDSFLTTGGPIIATQSIRSLATKSVTLAGTIIPDGHETKWYFQYGTTAVYGGNTSVRSAGSGVKVVDVARGITGLTPNTVYHFRLVAVSIDGAVFSGDMPFETLGPSISSSSSAVTFGAPVTLTGIVPSGAANQDVAIYSQAANSPSFVAVATILTGAGGGWAYGVQPAIGTNYKAIWHGEISPTISVGVSPSVTLREPSHGRFVTHVAAGTRFRGRLVRLQRLEHGVWRNIAQRRLNANSSASFRPSLPAGQSRLRIDLTAFQAGPGYLAALSGVHSYKI